ncbi:MAG: hypothetical protein AAF828_01430 [Bacteroidota bacterium]
MIKFMPQQDPLEELFRRNEHRMDQRPSLRTWRRLEDRLDGKNSRRTQGPFRPWMYAAAVVVLCTFIAALGPNLFQPANELAQRPESVEELDMNASVIQRAKPYQGIAEGDRHQILQVRNQNPPKLLPAPKYRL